MKQNDQSLIINLSMLVKKPTGIANYINNVLPYFNSLKYRSLVPETYSDHDYIKEPYLISDRLNPDFGSKGNFSTSPRTLKI